MNIMVKRTTWRSWAGWFLFAALLVMVVWLQGCSHDPVSSESTNNPQVPVELMFEHDSCKVYRFYDGGRRHFFVRCRSEVASTLSTQRCGKHCTRDELISTEETP
jgi:hypothetical protein